MSKDKRRANKAKQAHRDLAQGGSRTKLTIRDGDENQARMASTIAAMLEMEVRIGFSHLAPSEGIALVDLLKAYIYSFLKRYYLLWRMKMEHTKGRKKVTGQWRTISKIRTP